MREFIELNHAIETGMPGFRIPNGDGSYDEFSATIKPFLTHEETLPRYDGQVSFEITSVQFESSIGTYLDSPAHRYEGERDIGEIELSEIVTEGVVIDVRGAEPNQAVWPEALPTDLSLRGKAVLFNFGWDEHWGTEAYRDYPFIAESLVDQLIEEQVAIVGVDTLNIDDTRNPERPAHSKLLAEEILIVENLCNLDQLYGTGFRFYAIPIRAVGAVAMPVRAFAEIWD